MLTDKQHTIGAQEDSKKHNDNKKISYQKKKNPIMDDL